jgi:hypothetical protein
VISARQREVVQKSELHGQADTDSPESPGPLLGKFRVRTGFQRQSDSTPIHASWLNQIEIYFSIVQRKVLTPNDFLSLVQLEQRLLAFQKHYQQTASPFQWTFTRKDLNALLIKLSTKAIAAAA